MKTPEEMAEEYAECLFTLAFRKAYGASPAEMLEMHNSKLPKDARTAALHHFIRKFEGEYVDIPIASDAKGSLQYSRYRLTDFLRNYEQNT